MDDDLQRRVAELKAEIEQLPLHRQEDFSRALNRGDETPVSRARNTVCSRRSRAGRAGQPTPPNL
jgi:hypothetical protein